MVQILMTHFSHDYMAGTRRDDTDIHLPLWPPLREASLAGKFRWQGLLGAPWRKLSGTSYAWPHGFQNLSKGNSPPSIEAIQSIQPILKIQTQKNIRFVQSLPGETGFRSRDFFQLPTFFWEIKPMLKRMVNFFRISQLSKKSWSHIGCFRCVPLRTTEGVVEGVP